MSLHVLPDELVRLVVSFVTGPLQFARPFAREHGNLVRACKRIRDAVHIDWTHLYKERWGWADTSGETRPLQDTPAYALLRSCVRHVAFDGAVSKSAANAAGLTEVDLFGTPILNRPSPGVISYTNSTLYRLDNIMAVAAAKFESPREWIQEFHRKQEERHRELERMARHRRRQLMVQALLAENDLQTYEYGYASQQSQLINSFVCQGQESTFEKLKADMAAVRQKRDLARAAHQARQARLFRVQETIRNYSAEMNMNLGLGSRRTPESLWMQNQQLVDYVVDENGTATQTLSPSVEEACRQHVQHWYTRQTAVYNRRTLLRNELAKHGLTLRSDSAYCAEFIRGDSGPGTCVQQVVAIMRISDALFRRGGRRLWSKHRHRLESRLRFTVRTGLQPDWQLACDAVLADELPKKSQCESDDEEDSSDGD